MKNGQGKVAEIFLDSRTRLICPQELIPAPGQYLHAHAVDSDDPLAASVFFSDSAVDGFLAAPGLSRSWQPGTQLRLRGPLGHGFIIPAAARRIALVAFDDSPERLRGLIPLAFQQEAEIVLVCDASPHDFPEAVEVQPLQALGEICRWADFAAFDAARENLSRLVAMVKGASLRGQILTRAPMPCGALAECGVCSLLVRNEWKQICRDGPVFALSDLCL
ncbi:MAG: hypothetical protein LDL51_02735 [Chloroflexi bacterium]|nr:hypothetical protein [Chloroflexota bacterium]